MHRDGSIAREDGARTRVTLMVYLSDVDAGGETVFSSEQRIIVPRAGTAVFFQHSLLHEARAVVAGTKYVLRADVFYAPA
jgi:prolyl 4-hydroxylase